MPSAVSLNFRTNAKCAVLTFYNIAITTAICCGEHGLEKKLTRSTSLSKVGFKAAWALDDE